MQGENRMAKIEILELDSISEKEYTRIVKANIEPICVYKISKYALLCFAEVIELTDLPNYEMAEIGFFDNEPQLLSYPEAHKLFFEVIKSKKKL